MWLLKSCSASTPPLKPVSRSAVQIQSSILLPKSDDLCPIDILREILYFFLKLLEQLRRAELASHLPFFKCSIAARKMWRCQLQTKVSCGSLWTRGATWYLWPPFARAPGLQGRWNFFHGKGHDVRTFGLKNLGNRPAGSALKSTLYSAGEFNKVGSFRRCSRKKAELLLLWRRARAATMLPRCGALHSGWIPDETTHGHIGQLDPLNYKPKRWLTRK